MKIPALSATSPRATGASDSAPAAADARQPSSTATAEATHKTVGPRRPPRDAASLAATLRARGFTGEVLTTQEELAPYGRDYGKLVQRTPRIVVKPATTRDVQLAVQLAGDSRLTVRTRSGGHGLEGQGLSNGGMVIATDKLRLPSGERAELVSRDGVQMVRVVPGAKTGELIKFLAERGLRLRNSTMDIYPGIGGAVSTAGIGQGSHRYGSMADQVMEIAGVTGDARTIRARSSRGDYSKLEGRDAAIAEAMLGGMGQAGVITELTFPVVPIKGHLRLFREPLPSVEALADRVAQLNATAGDDVAAIWGMVTKHPATGQLLYLASSVRDVADPKAGEPLSPPPDPGAAPGVYPAWLDVIHPSMAGAKQFLAGHPELVSDLNTKPGMMLLIPQKKIREDRTTLNTWGKAPVGADMLALGTFYYLNESDAVATVGNLRNVRNSAINDYGAQPYFMDGVPGSSAGWVSAIGRRRYDRFIDTLDRADPKGVFERLPGLERRRSRG